MALCRTERKQKMSKLLKHFGISYGNSKKSDTFDYRAKTLPASTTDRHGVRVFADTLKSSSRRNVGTSSHTVDDSGSRSVSSSSHSSRRASHETFFTIPYRGLSARREHGASLRGTNNREPLHPSATLCGQRDSELTGSKKRRSSDTKDLRRSVTADDISRSEKSVAPAVCINQCYMVLGVHCTVLLKSDCCAISANSAFDRYLVNKWKMG